MLQVTDNFTWNYVEGNVRLTLYSLEGPAFLLLHFDKKFSCGKYLKINENYLDPVFKLLYSPCVVRKEYVFCRCCTCSMFRRVLILTVRGTRLFIIS